MSAFAEDLFEGRRFAVVGLGRNGLPAAHALQAMGATWWCGTTTSPRATPLRPSI